jgi:hypothetical protein
MKALRLIGFLCLVLAGAPLGAAKPTGWYCFTRVYTETGVPNSLCERTQLACLHDYTAINKSPGWKDVPPICGYLKAVWSFSFYDPKYGITFYATPTKAECEDSRKVIPEGSNNVVLSECVLTK